MRCPVHELSGRVVISCFCLRINSDSAGQLPPYEQQSLQSQRHGQQCLYDGIGLGPCSVNFQVLGSRKQANSLLRAFNFKECKQQDLVYLLS
eukprot:1822891-Amphidinium_carterae.1